MNIGDKVVCVNDSIDLDKRDEINRIFLIWVKRDTEYTIRDIMHNDNIVTGILLEEVHNFPVFIKLIGRVQEPAFADWRFRKLSHQVQKQEVTVEETMKI